MKYIYLSIFILSSALSFSQMENKGAIKIAFNYEDVNESFEDTIIIKYFHIEGKHTITDTFLLKNTEKIPSILFEIGTYTVEISGNKIPTFIITDVIVKSNRLTFIEYINLTDYPDKNATIRLKYKSPTSTNCG